MKRRNFLTSLGLGIGSLVATNCQSILQKNKKKNVLFIAVDDLRPQLGCYGQKQILSPNIDNLAKNGLLFERAYCQQAVCGPSRASLLSGMRPDSTKVVDLLTPLRSVHPNIVTLPQIFKNNGYKTISLGKIYHHEKDDLQGWSTSPWRADNTSYYSPEGKKYAKIAKVIRKQQKKAEKKCKTKQEIRQVRYGKKYHYVKLFVDHADMPDNAYPDGKTADKAIAELNSLQQTPFFLAVGFRKPHLPFNAPQKYWDLYKDKDLKYSSLKNWPKNMPPIASSSWGELRKYYHGKDANQPKYTKQLIHGYYACVSFVDAQIGKVVNHLKKLGLYQNTIIILWGDHGWKLGDYNAWCKHTNFEIDTHVPMILSAPNYRKSAKTKALSEFVDIYPTLAELCSLTLPKKQCEGTSMVPLLKNPERKWKQAAFSQYPRKGGRVMGYSMRTKRWRYCEWIEQRTNKIVARELYDHKTNTLDTINLANNKEYSQTIKQLSAILNKGQGWKKMQKQD